MDFYTNKTNGKDKMRETFLILIDVQRDSAKDKLAI